jgi:predicted GNAT family acetyltransferase
MILVLHRQNSTRSKVRRMSEDVRNNEARNRFELDVDGHMAFASYRMAPGVIIFVHTEVPAPLSGRGIGSKLVRGALEYARSQRFKVVPQCPFVAAYIGKHPEFNDLLA